MSAFILAGTIFVTTLGGVWLGTLLRRTLPRHHLNDHAKDVVRLGVGLIAAIAALVQDELVSLLGVRALPKHTWIHRWKRAIPQYTLGHLGRMAALDSAEGALPGLYFCANYRGGISVADCIKSTRATADRIAQYLR